MTFIKCKDVHAPVSAIEWVSLLHQERCEIFSFRKCQIRISYYMLFSFKKQIRNIMSNRVPNIEIQMNVYLKML